jgi:hypothetical protein
LAFGSTSRDTQAARSRYFLLPGTGGVSNAALLSVAEALVAEGLVCSDPPHATKSNAISAKEMNVFMIKKRLINRF